MEWIDPAIAESARPFLLFGGLPFALGGAIYTAFLFGQAEGRDLWQSPLLPMHLLVQATMVGAAGVLVMSAFMSLPEGLASIAKGVFVTAVLLDLFVTLLGEFGMPHASEIAARAAHEISHGRYRTEFWWGAIVLGHALPLALLWAGAPLLVAVAGFAAVAGLWFFEHAFVMAPQEIPNS
jgi:Ni/Fe-hydrogenase subunit HybB-like protein